MDPHQIAPYETPRIEDYGDLKELTASKVGGGHYDAAAFQGGTVTLEDEQSTPAGP